MAELAIWPTIPSLGLLTLGADILREFVVLVGVRGGGGVGGGRTHVWKLFEWCGSCVEVLKRLRFADVKGLEGVFVEDCYIVGRQQTERHCDGQVKVKAVAARMTPLHVQNRQN